MIFGFLIGFVCGPGDDACFFCFNCFVAFAGFLGFTAFDVGSGRRGLVLEDILLEGLPDGYGCA